MFDYIEYWIKWPILKLIRLYQKTISPDQGWLKPFFPNGFCRFNPHCSEYCYQAVNKYGLFFGLIKCMFRVARCHPWSKGGNDPLV